MRILILATSIFLGGHRQGLAQTLAEALDSPGLVWTTGGDLTWRPGISETAREGGDLALCGPYSSSLFKEKPVVAWVETEVTGPGTFRIFVRSNGNPYLTASLTVDGVALDKWLSSNETGVLLTPTLWKPLSVPLGAGYHTIRLTGVFNQTGTQPINQPTLHADNAALLPPMASAGGVLEANGQVWLNGGDPGLITVNDMTHDGMDALSAPAQIGAAWLQTDVMGPATVSWWRKGVTRVSVEGLAAAHALREDWTLEKAFVPDGSQVIRWERAGNPGFWLDEFTAAAETPVTLAGALDTADLHFRSSQWQAHSSSAAPDETDLAWAEATANSDAWLETEITGPAMVDFKRCVRGTRPHWNVLADNRTVLTLSGSNGDEWTDQSFLLGAGPHTVRWQNQRDEFSPAGRSVLMLDQLRIRLIAATTLQEAMDGDSLEWNSPGDVPWLTAATAAAHDGTDSSFSDSLQNGQRAVLETTVTGPGTFAFWWQSKVQGGSSRITVDATTLKENSAYSGPLSWRREVVEVPEGSHSFRWEVSGPCGAGALLVDQAEWAPATAPPMASALDTPGMLFHASEQSVLHDSTVFRDGGSSLRLEVPPLTSTYGSYLSFWVNGPATVIFHTRSMNAYLTAKTDGSAYQTHSLPEWTSATLQILPGRRQLLLTHDRLSTAVNTPAASWIDSLTITSTAVGLGEGLSAPGFDWRTNPANPWMGINSPSLLARPGPASSPEPSWLETTVQGPAVVEFHASSRIDLHVDGSLHTKLNYPFGQGGPSLIFLQPGKHTLRWVPDPDNSSQNPALALFSAALMPDVPSLKFENGKWLYTVPRPMGLRDERITLEHASAPDFYFSRLFNPTVVSSTPEAIIYHIAPPGSQPGRYFLRTGFLPEY